MHSPTIALAWELWRRHRVRILLIVGTLLVFSVVYPLLCVWLEFDVSREGTGEVARKIALGKQSSSFLHVIYILVVLFLAAGPAMAMVMSLLCMAWMCTFTEFNLKTRDFLAFPTRLFTLPISTSFLFWRLMLGGLAAVGGLYAIWVYCVPMPRLEIFGVYHNCLGWLTLLVVGQGIVWSLAGWPITRTLAWLTVFFLFLCSPARRDIVESPLILLLFVLGVLLARLGLQKMRHGEWQGWTWRRPFAGWAARAELRGPKQFASPAQAQLWFEWRRSAAKICFFTIALALVPVALLLLRVTAGYPYLPMDDMNSFAVFLAGMPPVIYFLHGISPLRTDQSFLLARPLTSGEQIFAILKALSLSVLLSMAVVGAVCCLMPGLGDFQSVLQGVSPLPGRRVALVIGVIFLTWRNAIINLCFSLTGNRRAHLVPVLLIYGGAVMAFVVVRSENHWIWLWDNLAWFAAGLVAMKFLLAGFAFKTCLEHRLLAPAAVVCYLTVWSLLVAALLATLLLLVHPDQNQVILDCLGIVLLVPLARIGFSPLALAWSRKH